METTTTVAMSHWLARLHAGDPGARDRLLDCAFERLARLTRRMLNDDPRIGRRDQAGDVRREALIRMSRAMEQGPPATVRDFLRLAACQIRRELIDLARHHRGPLAPGPHLDSTVDLATDGPAPAGPMLDPTDTTKDPARLAAWTEFHERVEALPDEEREAFDLLWYQGLTQAESAAVLGVDERTVQRRWQAARIRIYQRMEGRIPGL
jgi:RNA polymerase sigma factor (sigma-70 family)